MLANIPYIMDPMGKDFLLRVSDPCFFWHHQSIWPRSRGVVSRHFFIFGFGLEERSPFKWSNKMDVIFGDRKNGAEMGIPVLPFNHPKSFFKLLLFVVFGEILLILPWASPPFFHYHLVWICSCFFFPTTTKHANLRFGYTYPIPSMGRFYIYRSMNGWFLWFSCR